MIIRTLWRAVNVEEAQSPYNTIHLKVFYPGGLEQSEEEQNLGLVAVEREHAPYPVVIFFNGVNCGLEIYQWLAHILANKWLVVVVFNWVAEEFPGLIALSPGVKTAAWSKEFYGTMPSSSTLPVILTELENLQTESILAGSLDLNKIILGGHSAGGRVALENANPQFFPQVVAAFGYGVHSAMSVQAGYSPATIAPLPSSLPLLVMGGTSDGIIAQSSFRYGLEQWETPATPTIRTFQEAISGGRNDSYLVILAGANHLSIGDGVDSTTGRAFLDFPTTHPQNQYRALIAEIVSNFIDAHVRQNQEAFKELEKLLTTRNPLIAKIERK